MGNYCCGGGEDGVEPDSHHNVSAEERRRLAAEAAQKRIREAEGRGMRDPEGFKQRQANKEKVMAEAMEQGQGQPSGGLKWTVS